MHEYKLLFKAMPIPRLIVVPEGRSGYRVMEANDAAIAYFTKDTSDKPVIGQRIEEFLTKDTFNQFEQTFEVSKELKRMVSIKALPGIPGQTRIYSFIVNPYIDPKGEVAYLDMMGQPDSVDQTFLKRERDDAVLMLSSIFESSEIGIIVTDDSGRVVRVNDSFVRSFGWTRDELVNSELASLVTPDERESMRQNFEHFLHTGIHGSGEMKLIKREGSVAYTLYTTSTMELSQKRRYQATTVIDITIRKQMEQSLRTAKEQADAANRSKSTFLANMSHELRTPLNAIIGFSEMMKEETFGPLGHDKYHEYVADINTSASLLLEIINEVLDMSKVEAGKIVLDETDVDIVRQIETVTRIVAARAFGNNQNIVMDVQGRLPKMRADERLIRQILINLVTNAAKFSNDGGTVRVSAAQDDAGRMVIKIQDQGIGIPKDKISKAMEPFAQVFDNPELAKKPGTGLGLPLAKAMVELHGGTIGIESDTGKGTMITLTFPAHRIILSS